MIKMILTLSGKINSHYLNHRSNATLPMIRCLLLLAVSCHLCRASSLPISGNPNGDYTFSGLNSEDLQSEPSQLPSSSSSSSGSSAVGSLLAFGNDVDSAKQWIQLKHLLTDLGRQRTLSEPNHRNWKRRSCAIDAGMTYNCDFRELLSAVNARKYLESSMTPGRKKRLLPLIYRSNQY